MKETVLIVWLVVIGVIVAIPLACFVAGFVCALFDIAADRFSRGGKK